MDEIKEEPQIEEIKDPKIKGDTLDDIRKQFNEINAEPPKQEETPLVIQPEPEEDPVEVAKWEKTILYNSLRGIEWVYSGAHAFGYNVLHKGESRVEHDKIRLEPSEIEQTINEMPNSVKKWMINNMPWYVGTIIRVEQNYITKISEHSQPVNKKEDNKEKV